MSTSEQSKRAIQRPTDTGRQPTRRDERNNNSKHHRHLLAGDAWCVRARAGMETATGDCRVNDRNSNHNRTNGDQPTSRTAQTSEQQLGRRRRRRRRRVCAYCGCASSSCCAGEPTALQGRAAVVVFEPRNQIQSQALSSRVIENPKPESRY